MKPKPDLQIQGSCGTLVIKNSTLISMIFLSCVLFVFPAYSQSYQIVFERKEKVGDRYKVFATGSQSKNIKAKIKGEVIKDDGEESKTQLTGEIVVLELGKAGFASRASIKVEQCLYTQGDVTKNILPAEAIVMAFLQNDKTVFEIDKSPAPQHIAEALGLVIALNNRRIRDEDIFGTNEKKKIGDSWKINRNYIKAYFKEIGMDANEKDVEGSITLEKLAQVEQETCIVIRGVLSVSNASIDASESKQNKGQMQVEFYEISPVNTSLRSVEEGNQIKFLYTSTIKPAPDIPEVTLDVTMKSQMKAQRTYLK